MGSVGGVTATAMQSLVPLGSARQGIEVIERPGVDGRSYREVGLRPAEGQYLLVTFHSSAANLASAKGLLSGLQGDMTTLVDPMGTSHNVIVLGVDHRSEQRCLLVPGGIGNWRLETVVSVEKR